MYRPQFVVRTVAAIIILYFIFLYTDNGLISEDYYSLNGSQDFDQWMKDIRYSFNGAVNHVDAVITYVNGSDPQFLRDLQRISKDGVKIDYSAASNRFKDHNDLKILLRSIDKYGKIFRHIYLVISSPSQIPIWLQRNSKRLKIIFHQDIWNNSSELPNFNSLAIEANLHHIKGLSNVFVYFNDDLTLLNPVKLDDFVLLNSTRHLLAVKIRPDIKLPEGYVPSENGTDSHWVGPAIRTREFIGAVCSERKAQISTFGHIPNHTPHVLMRSVLYQAESHPKLIRHFRRTWKSRFRDGYDLQTVMLFNSFAHCHANVTTVWSPKNELIYIGANHGTDNPQYLVSMKNVVTFFSHKIVRGEAKFLCMNDVSDFFNSTENGEKAVQLAYSWRNNLFPTKSTFEL